MTSKRETYKCLSVEEKVLKMIDAVKSGTKKKKDITDEYGIPPPFSKQNKTKKRRRTKKKVIEGK